MKKLAHHTLFRYLALQNRCNKHRWSKRCCNHSAPCFLRWTILEKNQTAIRFAISAFIVKVHIHTKTKHTHTHTYKKTTIINAVCWSTDWSVNVTLTWIITNVTYGYDFTVQSKHKQPSSMSQKVLLVYIEYFTALDFWEIIILKSGPTLHLV